MWSTLKATKNPTHLVILQDGYKVPCWGLDDAVATVNRFADKGIRGTIRLA